MLAVDLHPHSQLALATEVSILVQLWKGLAVNINVYMHMYRLSCDMLPANHVRTTII